MSPDTELKSVSLILFAGEGDLFAWGKNRVGTLGLSHAKDQFFPFKVSDLCSFHYSIDHWKLVENEKVLLHERQRHTARRVASVRYAALSNGGVPHPVLVGGTPSQVQVRGTSSSPGQRFTPSQVQVGGYPIPSSPC